jgi:hypothetical protein
MTRTAVMTLHDTKRPAEITPAGHYYPRRSNLYRFALPARVDM